MLVEFLGKLLDLRIRSPFRTDHVFEAVIIEDAVGVENMLRSNVEGAELKLIQVIRPAHCEPNLPSFENLDICKIGDGAAQSCRIHEGAHRSLRRKQNIFSRERL